MENDSNMLLRKVMEVTSMNCRVRPVYLLALLTFLHPLALSGHLRWDSLGTTNEHKLKKIITDLSKKGKMLNLGPWNVCHIQITSKADEADVHFDCFPTNTTVFLIFTLLALTRKNQQFIPLMLITDIQTDPTVQQTGIMVSTERCRGDASPTQITSPLPSPHISSAFSDSLMVVIYTAGRGG